MKIYNNMMQLIVYDKKPRQRVKAAQPPTELVGNTYKADLPYREQTSFDGDKIELSRTSNALLETTRLISQSDNGSVEITTYKAIDTIANDLRKASNYISAYRLNFSGNPLSLQQNIAEISERITDTIANAEYNDEPILRESPLFTQKVVINNDAPSLKSIRLDLTTPARYPRQNDIRFAIRALDNEKQKLAVDIRMKQYLESPKPQPTAKSIPTEEATPIATIAADSTEEITDTNTSAALESAVFPEFDISDQPLEQLEQSEQIETPAQQKPANDISLWKAITQFLFARR